MTIVETPNTADFVQRRFITDLAPQRVGGVRRVDNHAAGAHDVRGLAYQSWLWIVRVNLKKLAHACRLNTPLPVLIYNAPPRTTGSLF
jgi:hypothetical protein